MTIYPDPPPPFDCTICGAAQMTTPFSKYPRSSNPIPPLCMRCEKDWGQAVGGWGDLNRDRRTIRQVSALAEIIMATAHCKQNGRRGPYDRA